jgi:hypothetical protein
MKKCFKCGIEKDLDEFYKHPEMPDGHVNKCKECNKKDNNQNRQVKVEYYREYDRKRANLPHRVKAREAYSKTDECIISSNAAKKRWNQNNKLKRLATNILNNAIRDHKIIKKPCEICGSIKRIHGHHNDYYKPLEVIWLCPKHHSEYHKKLREQERQNRLYNG